MKNEIEKIREAWFLFPPGGSGIIRYIAWIIICILSFYSFRLASSDAFGKVNLVFSASLFMEFFPHLNSLLSKLNSFLSNLNSFPSIRTGGIKALKKECNRKQNISIVCLVYLGILICVSLWIALAEADSLPKWFSFQRIKKFYFIMYIVGFVYLFINCMMGLKTNRVTSDEQSGIMDSLVDAAQYGQLGNVTK